MRSSPRLSSRIFAPPHLQTRTSTLGIGVAWLVSAVLKLIRIDETDFAEDLSSNGAVGKISN